MSSFWFYLTFCVKTSSSGQIAVNLVKSPSVRSLEHVFKVHRNHEIFKIRFGKFRHPRGVQGQSRDGHEDMHQPNPSHSLPSSIWTPSLRFSFIKWCLEAIMAPKPGNSHIFTHKWSCKFTDIIWNNIIFGRGLVWFPVNMNASVLHDFLSDLRRTKQPNVWNLRFLQ